MDLHTGRAPPRIITVWRYRQRDISRQPPAIMDGHTVTRDARTVTQRSAKGAEPMSQTAADHLAAGYRGTEQVHARRRLEELAEQFDPNDAQMRRIDALSKGDRAALFAKNPGLHIGYGFWTNQQAAHDALKGDDDDA